MTQLFKSQPFIIAEIGSNWTNFGEAKDAISYAKQAGADAVKFQLFDDSAMYGPGIRGSWYTGPLATLHQLPQEWLPKLKEKANACGIEFMCSAFSPELYDAVDPFVEVHKIASSELTHPHLLERVKAKGKPILLSVGASSKGDVAQAMQILRGGPQVVLLYCVAAYPARQYNLFKMEDLKQFGVPVGLSDHSLDVVYPALSAVKHFGAVVIEKHVNFALCGKTPDAKHSLSGDDFVYMCEHLRGKRDSSFNPAPEERDMFLRHNRRLIAIRDIAVGDAFRYGENFGAYRALEDDSAGVSGFMWQDLVKSSGAKQAIKAGQPIAPEDFL